MKFDCLVCGGHTFSIDGPSFVNDSTPAVTLSCPLCTAYHAIEHRPGGGLVVSIDAHLTGIEDARSDARAAALAQANGTEVPGEKRLMQQ